MWKMHTFVEMQYFQLRVGFSGLITPFGKRERERERELFFQLSITRNVVIFVQVVFSSSWCLGKVALLYCGTPCGFRITSFVVCFWCQSFCDVSLYMCSYYFSSISVAE